MNELRELQRWMVAVCTAGDGAQQAAGAVHSSPALPAAERLAIYSRGYVARLQDHLRARYPMLRSLVGDDVFDLFTLAYIRSRPPTSYTLADYGADFPDYLDATRPRDAGKLGELPAAVARMDLINCWRREYSPAAR